MNAYPPWLTRLAHPIRKAGMAEQIMSMEDQDFYDLDEYEVKKILKISKNNHKESKAAMKNMRDMLTRHQFRDENFDRVAWREEVLEKEGKGKKGQDENEPMTEEEEGEEGEGAEGAAPATGGAAKKEAAPAGGEKSESAGSSKKK